jgi:hypothetical protein
VDVRRSKHQRADVPTSRSAWHGIEARDVRPAPDRLVAAHRPALSALTVAALVSSPDILEPSGTIHWVDALAVEFGIADERQPANA